MAGPVRMLPTNVVRRRVEVLRISVDEVSAHGSDHMAWPLEEHFRGSAANIQASDGVVVARIPADGIQDAVSGGDGPEMPQLTGRCVHSRHRSRLSTVRRNLEEPALARCEHDRVVSEPARTH